MAPSLSLSWREGANTRYSTFEHRLPVHRPTQQGFPSRTPSSGPARGARRATARYQGVINLRSDLLVEWARNDATGTRRQNTGAHHGAHKRRLAQRSEASVAFCCKRQAPAQQTIRALGALGIICAAARDGASWARRAATNQRSLQDRRERTGWKHGAIQRRAAVRQGQLSIQRGHATLPKGVELAAHDGRCHLTLVRAHR
jgi:hypothetical protein